MKYYHLFLIVSFCLLWSCLQEQKVVVKTSIQDKNAYWYNGGGAEISSYNIKQARYGEIHEGKAVFVYVTEPFSPTKNTKADRTYGDNVSVLKLNTTKKFTTGIYPYSMMNSTFYPFKKGVNSLKISSSSQEWCGHTFMDLKQDSGGYIGNINSYFEGESQRNIQLDSGLLEDDIWTKIRLQPSELPTGEQKMLPGLFYLRLMHQLTEYVMCEVKHEIDEKISIYTIYYPSLDRTLAIKYQTAFPHIIESWEETYYSGYGLTRKKLTTTASRLKTIRSKYWEKNKKVNKQLRKELKLD